MNCLLIDVGSTFIKYGIYDEITKQIIHYDAVPFPAPIKRNDTEFLISANEIKGQITKIFGSNKEYNIKRAFISVQMHGFILKTDDNNDLIYVSWRDKSGNIENPLFDNIDFNKMGTSLKNNLPLVKLLPDNPHGEFFTLGSYISWILTGKNATHITDGCASGFYYSDSGKCNEYAGNLTMPEIYKEITSIGDYNGIDIYTPAGDFQVSFMGSMADDDKYLINIGTATQVCCLYNKSFADGNYEKRPFFDRNIVYTVSGLVGGDILHKGDGKEELLHQILDALKILPHKKEILFGGGGAEQIFEFMKTNLDIYGYKCSLIKNNIGMEGLKKMAEQKRIKSGTMLSEICFPNFPVIAKNSGLDFIIIDNEHGNFDYGDISRLVMNANLIGIEVIVRIGDSSRAHITKLADMGVSGFLLPMTNCAADIEVVVQYAKYTPVGKRGISTTRAHTLYNPPPLLEYMEAANKKMKIYAQIETVSGMENLKDILMTDGVEGIFIGPNDLSIDMACINDKDKLYKAIKTIAEGANAHNKPFGIITGNKDLIDIAAKNNARMISIGSELNMLINGCKKISKDIMEL